jgi:hypothetical protein
MPLRLPEIRNRVALAARTGVEPVHQSREGAILLGRSVQVAILLLFSFARMKRILLARLGVNRAFNERWGD